MNGLSYSLPEPLVSLWALIDQKIGSQRLINGINILALMLLTHSLATWTWKLVQPTLTPVIAQSVHNSHQVSHKINLQALLRANLFGQAAIAQQDATTPDQVPLSSLNLLLTGVVAAGDSSIALISVSGQPQTPFLIGEEVAQGAVLDAVYPDRAILQRAGILESLVLEDLDISLVDTEPDNRSSLNRPTAPVSIGDIRSMGNNSFSFPHQLIKQQLGNPRFLADAQIVPKRNGGGFVVQKLKKGSLYEKLGLRRGDIIQDIDGQQINTAQDAMAHYQKLNGQGHVTVGVQRNGRPLTLQFHLE